MYDHQQAVNMMLKRWKKETKIPQLKGINGCS